MVFNATFILLMEETGVHIKLYQIHLPINI